MAKAKARYGTTGRITPKKEVVVETVEERAAKAQPDASKRYTPPTPVVLKESPLWVPILMYTFIALGALLIVLNYAQVIPGSPQNWYLLIGLGLVTGGFITSTKYH